MDEDEEQHEEEKKHPTEEFKQIISQLPREIRVFEKGISPEIMEEYRKLAADIQKEQDDLPEGDIRKNPSQAVLQAELENPTNWVDIDKFKQNIILAANFANAEMFRFLRTLEAQAIGFQSEWIYAAQMQCQMRLENSLMDEPVGFIATALGGKGIKIRYYFAVAAANPLDAGMTRFIVQDYQDAAQKYNVEIEETTQGSQFILFRVLVPYDKLITEFIASGINSSSILLDSEFWVTNVVKPTADALDEWVNRKRS
jgi:hypothetical protein